MKKRRSKMLFSMVVILSLSLMARINMIFASDIKGSISIDYHVTAEQDKKVYPSGVQFAVYQIGCFHDGAAVLNQKFQASGVSLEDPSASARNRQAKELYAYASKKELAGITAETKDGKIEFKNIDMGIYLVAQTERYSYAEKGWFDSEPFLLSIPLELNGEWMYDVHVEPKTMWTPISQPDKPKPTTPSNNPPGGSSPHTGDDTHMWWWIAAALASATGVVLLQRCKKEEKI